MQINVTRKPLIHLGPIRSLAALVIVGAFVACGEMPEAPDDGEVHGSGGPGHVGVAGPVDRHAPAHVEPVAAQVRAVGQAVAAGGELADEDVVRARQVVCTGRALEGRLHRRLRGEVAGVGVAGDVSVACSIDGDTVAK